ncbi:hypothetical protein [Methylocystis sp.]|uniref:hypothetical protein n=1 Tax=Methylocystis sp. TaxID=1911079 RepID=UPI0027332C72|nr:hypothetical protein [Methylocystis sp.]MDP3554853.1 hypothetical protein [Methylocystis sp.]
MASCALLRVMDPRDEQRAWLLDLLARTGEAPTSLAHRAGLAPTTLTRFLNDPEHGTALSARTISAVEKAAGVRFGAGPQIALRDREAEPFVYEQAGETMGAIVRAAVGVANGIDPWTLRSRALEAAGLMPGDTLIVDLNADPKAGDVVCAQVYEWARGKAETVFRIFEPPSLVSATLDPALRKPLFVDHHNIVIKGVVVASIRTRQARAA